MYEGNSLEPSFWLAGVILFPVTLFLIATGLGVGNILFGYSVITWIALHVLMFLKGDDIE